MGCVSSTAAHEMPFDVVASVFDTWGRGGFNGPDAKANTEAFFSPDCYMSFSTNCGFKNSDMFKDYYGHAGMMEFTRRLLEMEFKDFTPTISAGEKGQVLVRATYTPTNKASGRTTDAPLTDLQEWTVVKGKVTKVVITHTEPKKMDATFFTNEEACGVVTKAIMAWGEGKFSDSNKASKESFKEFFTPDAVTVADADMKNTTGYKTYEGDTGFFEWIRFLEEIEFGGFTLEGFSVIGGEVVVRASYTPTVKATGKSPGHTTDMQSWVLTNGKISHVKFFWGAPSKLDACFA